MSVYVTLRLSVDPSSFEAAEEPEVAVWGQVDIPDPYGWGR